MAIVHHWENPAVFVCLFVLCFFISFLMCIPQNILQYAHFDAANLHGSPQGHFNVDNGTQGFPCIDACCWIELASG